MKGGVKIGARLDKWLDDWQMALSGTLLAFRNYKFIVVWLLSAAIFGTLINLLASSTAALNLFWATNLAGKCSILGDSFLAIFGVGRNFWDWLLNFAIIVLQSTLIALVALVWRKRQRSRRERLLAQVHNSDNLQSAGLVAGLAILGSGCPTCGTTLLMPVIGTIFSSGGYVLAGMVSGLLTVAAIILALFSLQRMGKEAYILICSERYQKRHAKTASAAKTEETEE